MIALGFTEAAGLEGESKEGSFEVTLPGPTAPLPTRMELLVLQG